MKAGGILMDFSEKRVLGRTGLFVSRLGLADGYKVPANAVEKAFHEYGINYFFWGWPRKRGMRDGLRNLVKNKREKMIIVFQFFDRLGIMLERSVKKRLKELGIDYVDIVMLGGHSSYPYNRLIKKALDLKERGLARFISMSGHNRKLFGEIAQKDDNPIDIFMVRYNAAHPGAETDIFPYISGENRPGLTTFTATCWGKLLKQKNMPQGEQPLTALDCYRFVLSDPHVDICMMGPASESEMDEGMTAITKGPLSSEETERIAKIGAHVYG